MNRIKTVVLAGMALFFFAVTHPSMAQSTKLTITDSVRLAMAHSPAVKAAEAAAAKAGWLVEENHSNFLPALSANHVQTRNYMEMSGAASRSRSSSLEAKVTLYSGGLNEALAVQSEELSVGARWELARVRQSVMANTCVAYYNVLQSEKNLALAGEAVDRLTQHLAIVRAQYEEGTVIKSDVLRTEVELAQARQNHGKAQNAYKLACSQFIILLGLPADQAISLADKDLALAYEGDITQAIKTGLDRRPDLKQAVQEEKAARQGIRIAESGHLPTVSLSVKKEWQNPEATNSPWAAQATVSFNVFDGGRTASKTRQAECEFVRTQELLRQKTEQVTLETQEAYFNMQNARTAVDIASQVVAKAEEDYVIAQVRYQSGIGTNLDVIDAQGALTSAKLNHSNARYDFNKYSIQLAQAMGTISEEEIHDKKQAAH